MTEPSQPLTRPPDNADSPALPPGFLWPSPPYAAYPQPEVQKAPEVCELLGLNNSRSAGQLLRLNISERLVQITVPPARNAVPLKFSQFRALKLMRPLSVPPRAAGDLNSPLSLDQRPRSNFRLIFNGGDELKGVTIGHLHDELGLFLFPPLSTSDDSVRRVFVPREVLAHFEIGERLGDVLLKDRLVTQEQLAAAAVEQTNLRQKRVGDILVDRHIVTVEQLLQAIDQQARMPMVRIGEALLALEFVTTEQLEQALAQQRTDRSVPLGELLVRKGVISRAQLQSALARKMGYPVVDAEHFAVEPDAVRKLPAAVAKRLEVLPLVLREGRLVVAMEDPTRRDAIDEIEFITQLKVVPTLTRLGSLQSAIPNVFERFGAEALPRGEADTPIDFQHSDFTAESSNKLIETLERDSSERNAREDELPIEQSDNSLVRLINSMIIEAHSQGVSDIHVETYPGRDKLKIRFRRDGQLQPYLELPHTYRAAVIARIKIMCDLDISERRKPQDGRQDQLRALLAPAQAGAARGYHPDQQRAGRRRHAPAGQQQAHPAGPHRPDGGQSRGAQGRHGPALWHGAVRGAHRLGQDDHAALGAGQYQHARPQDLDGRGPGRDHPGRAAPGPGQPQDRLDLRQGVARLFARRPGRHHGRRDPRPGDRRDRRRGLADRPPRAVHVAHQ